MTERKGLLNMLDIKGNYKPIKKCKKPSKNNDDELEYMANYLNYSITPDELTTLCRYLAIDDGSITATPTEKAKVEKAFYKIFYKESEGL
jgi:hypothetical protein